MTVLVSIGLSWPNYWVMEVKSYSWIKEWSFFVCVLEPTYMYNYLWHKLVLFFDLVDQITKLWKYKLLPAYYYGMVALVLP